MSAFSGVAYFDSGEIAGRPYMITEFVEGRTLRELGALSLDEALLYFRQLVGAVAASQAKRKRPRWLGRAFSMMVSSPRMTANRPSV